MSSAWTPVRATPWRPAIARWRCRMARGLFSIASASGAQSRARAGAVTAITAIDVSQRGGFGTARLDAHEHGVPALGYVVSYRALQAALDAALARAGLRVDHGVTVTQVDATPAYARIRGERDGAACEWTARLAAVADGGGDVVAGNVRASPRLPAACTGREALAGRAAPRRCVRALYSRGTDGLAAGRRSLRARVDDDAGAGQSACRDAGKRVPRRAGDAIRRARRRLSEKRGSAHVSAFARVRRHRRRRAHRSSGQRGAGTASGCRARVSTWVCATRTNWRRCCWRRRAIDSARPAVCPLTRAADSPIAGPALR